MGAVAAGSILFALLLIAVAAMVWQEARRRAASGSPTYVLDEAARFVHARLPEPAAARLAVGDVERILEWGLEHGAVVSRTGSAVLGSGDAMDHVMERAAAGGYDYDPMDVAAVMVNESRYLAAIGAVGDPVEEDET
jgi:hypothetical protein